MPLFESSSIVVDKDADGSVFLKLDVPDRPLNVLTGQVLADLDAALDQIGAEKRVPVVVVRSGKPSGFLAGADLNEFLGIQTPSEAEAISARGQAVFGKLADLAVPTVAMISGPCLGGGLELALACDYRLVFDRGATQLGLPEVTLGLLPGWGGTQRLPKVVGLERALQMILSGKRLTAREAQRWGLVDVLAANENELRQKFTDLKGRAVLKGKPKRKGLPLRTWRQRFLESHPFGRRVILRVADRQARRRIPDDMPAPLEALEAVRVGQKEGLEAGLAYERAAAGRLAVSGACRNLIGLFLQGEAAKKLPAALRAPQPAEVKRVGVIGGGVMGAGIAQLAAVKGFSVVIQEVDAAALGASLLRVQELFARAIERRVLSPGEAQKRLALVKGTVSWDGFKDVDVVVEAVVEDLEIKRKLFRELDSWGRPTTVLASNTSSLRIAQIGEGLKNPERLAGLHFFNPVHKMPLVEVVRTPSTRTEAQALLTGWALALGKVPVQVADSPGFVVNRILMPYLNEAVLLLTEGLPIVRIDLTMRRFGMPLGPLELLDEIGLDVAAHVAGAMRPILAERFETNPAFEQMRSNAFLGQKTGRGFYNHKGDKHRPNALAENLLKGSRPAASASLPLAARLAEARERMVLLMVNEAARVLAEGVAASAGDINLAMVLGTGWAPHRGGPLGYLKQRGRADVVRALEELTARYGRRFEPCAELRQA